MTPEQRNTTLANLITRGLYMGEKTLKQLAKRWGTDVETVRECAAEAMRAIR